MAGAIPLSFYVEASGHGSAAYAVPALGTQRRSCCVWSLLAVRPSATATRPR